MKRLFLISCIVLASIFANAQAIEQKYYHSSAHLFGTFPSHLLPHGGLHPGAHAHTPPATAMANKIAYPGHCVFLYQSPARHLRILLSPLPWLGAHPSEDTAPSRDALPDSYPMLSNLPLYPEIHTHPTFRMWHHRGSLAHTMLLHPAEHQMESECPLCRSWRVDRCVGSLLGTVRLLCPVVAVRNHPAGWMRHDQQNAPAPTFPLAGARRLPGGGYMWFHRHHFLIQTNKR